MFIQISLLDLVRLHYIEIWPGKHFRVPGPFANYKSHGMV